MLEVLEATPNKEEVMQALRALRGDKVKNALSKTLKVAAFDREGVVVDFLIDGEKAEHTRTTYKRMLEVLFGYLDLTEAMLFLKHLLPALEAIRLELEGEARKFDLRYSVPTTRAELHSKLRDPFTEISDKKTLGIPEASVLLGLRRSTLYKYTCQRAIPYYKLGSRVLFDEQKLRSWMEARAVEPIAISRSRPHG